MLVFQIWNCPTFFLVVSLELVFNKTGWTIVLKQISLCYFSNSKLVQSLLTKSKSKFTVARKLWSGLSPKRTSLSLMRLTSLSSHWISSCFPSMLSEYLCQEDSQISMGWLPHFFQVSLSSNVNSVQRWSQSKNSYFLPWLLSSHLYWFVALINTHNALCKLGSAGFSYKGLESKCIKFCMSYSFCHTYSILLLQR